ncbi:MAG: hypothetical protein JW731_16355 [Bacteroidales bacterium]|nr:hypothetical protein [Bacteroidales bacterium]
MIEYSRKSVAISVNAEITQLYWNIGRIINEDILKLRRAENGKEFVISLSKLLTEEFEKGWGEKQLRHCLRFAETFTDKTFVYALSRELT